MGVLVSMRVRKELADLELLSVSDLVVHDRLSIEETKLLKAVIAESRMGESAVHRSKSPRQATFQWVGTSPLSQHAGEGSWDGALITAFLCIYRLTILLPVAVRGRHSSGLT